MTEKTPLERFEGFPEPLQETLVEMATTLIDTTADEKSALYFWVDLLGNVDDAVVSRPMGAYKRVLDAVVVQVKLGVLRRKVQGATAAILELGGHHE